MMFGWSKPPHTHEPYRSDNSLASTHQGTIMQFKKKLLSGVIASAVTFAMIGSANAVEIISFELDNVVGRIFTTAQQLRFLCRQA